MGGFPSFGFVGILSPTAYEYAGQNGFPHSIGWKHWSILDNLEVIGPEAFLEIGNCILSTDGYPTRQAVIDFATWVHSLQVATCGIMCPQGVHYECHPNWNA
jgi:hypothetical protein